MAFVINGIDIDNLPKPYIEDHPEWIELYNFAWKKAAENIRECNGRRYMDCAWDFSKNFQWVWDTCFVTLYARYGNGEFPGISSLDSFYDLQRDDGFIAMTYDLNTGMEVYGERINPPLFAWCEWEYYKTTGDSSRFEKVVPCIEKLMDWIDNNRRCEPRLLRSKIASFTDALSKNEKNVKSTEEYPFYYFGDGGSSGQDDAPRTPRNMEAGKFYDWIDLSSQMVLSFRMLANIHGVLNNDKKCSYWADRANELSDAINNAMWCPITEFYHDRMNGTNFVPSKTVAGFWPILAGIAQNDKLEKLAAHLHNEKTFGRPLPVPSLAADDCNYNPDGSYWTGGVWAPTNYMITRGLSVRGKAELANNIATKYLAGLSETYKNIEPHTLWECYSPEYFLPGRTAYSNTVVKPDFVGWTGIGPIAMLIENILGIEINAPEHCVNWHILLDGAHGITNLKVGDALVELHYKNNTETGTPLVTAKSDKDISVNVFVEKNIHKLTLENGTEIKYKL